MCDQKIQEFLASRGLAIWDYNLLETSPVPDTVRYDVLRRAGGKCELCGVSAKERPHHVDHILPRSRKGKNDPDNLQALCSTCNLGKGNRDATDFRRTAPAKVEGCAFCADDVAAREIETNGTVFAVKDAYPVTDWRRGRDSNPRYRKTVQQISSLPPSSTQPPLRASDLSSVINGL